MSCSSILRLLLGRCRTRLFLLSLQKMSFLPLKVEGGIWCVSFFLLLSIIAYFKIAIYQTFAKTSENPALPATLSVMSGMFF